MSVDNRACGNNHNLAYRKLNLLHLDRCLSGMLRRYWLPGRQMIHKVSALALMPLAPESFSQHSTQSTCLPGNRLEKHSVITCAGSSHNNFQRLSSTSWPHEGSAASTACIISVTDKGLGSSGCMQKSASV